MNNPFAHIQSGTYPVKEEAFIGRKRYLAELLADIIAPIPRHVSVFGLPHIGKTSLLSQLLLLLEKQENLLPVPLVTFTCGSFSRCINAILRSLARVDPDAAAIHKLPKTDLQSPEYVERLDQALRAAAKGRRIVLLIDEFERHRGSGDNDGWSQADYDLFIRLLLDRSLDLVCITASRPNMHNILSDYKPAINPFVSKLLCGFDDSEMEEYFDLLEHTGVLLDQKPLRHPDNHDRLQELLRVCGRSPYLLTRLGNELCINADRPDTDVHKQTEITPLYLCQKEHFQTHFDEIIRFMVKEEDKKMRSFSHIVKCYFGLFADYQDIKERCIALGYLELVLQDSPYTYQGRLFKFDDIDDRFEICDVSSHLLTKEEKQRRGLVYTTVCPLFTDYLFAAQQPIGKDQIIPLALINDPHDLLTGLIHTMRDITKARLSAAWGSDWQETLVARYTHHQAHLLVRDPNGTYGLWERDNGVCKRLEPFPPGQGADVTETVAYHAERQRVQNDWSTLSASANLPVKLSSMKYVCSALNDADSDLPSIDPINLEDQAEIFCKFWNTNHIEFRHFFGALPNGKDGLKASMGRLREFRNRISHFSRSGYSHPTLEADKETCRDLIKRMYHYLYAGKAYPHS